MIVFLLAGVLAASPSPRAAKNADAVVYLPRVDRTSGLVAFFEHAGEHSMLLRPSNWEEEFHPLLPMSPAHLSSLSAAGLDPSASVTLSEIGETSMTCAGLKDPKVFRARMAEALRVRGEPWNARVSGGELVGAKSENQVVAGYALHDRLECSAAGAPDVEAVLKEGAALLAHPSSGWKDLNAVPGAAYLWLPFGLFGFNGTATQLSVEGKTHGFLAMTLAPGGSSPYGAIKPSGAIFLRAHIDPSSLNAVLSVIESQVLAACPACDHSGVRELTHRLAAQLTGQVVLRVDRLAPGPGMKTAADRFFAVKHAYLAELKQANTVSDVLKALGQWPQARATENGFVLSVPKGEIHVGAVGRHIYFGNDADAVKAIVDALPTAAAATKHGADFTADPRLIAKALARISLLDVMGSRELAAIFAASTELGPLLAGSESLTGWIDSAGAGSHRLSAVWTLAPAP